VINSHIKSHPSAKKEEFGPVLLEESMQSEDLIPQDMLKKYVIYAKRHVHPKLSDIDRDKITHFYTELRRESASLGGLPVGVRQVESILRMAESHARMHLRDYVRADDVNLAIRMMMESFLMTQKFPVARSLKKRFGPYLTHEQDSDQLLLHELNRAFSEKLEYLRLLNTTTSPSDVSVAKSDFEKRARDIKVTGLEKFFASPEFTTKYTFQNNLIKMK
jgi:DNA replication licensing factor MCM2